MYHANDPKALKEALPMTSRGQRIAVLFAALAVPLLLIGAVIVFRSMPREALAGVGAEISEVRQRGEPIEPQDLVRICPTSDAESQRAAEWMRLAELAGPADKFTDDAKPLPFVGELDVKDDALNHDDAGDLRVKARAYLAKHQAALSLAHDLRHDPRPVAYPNRFADGFDAKYPWVVSLRALNRLLAMECRLRAVQGETEESLESWLAMVALCESLRPQPCGVSCGVVETVRHSMLRLAIEQIQFNINHCSQSDEQLRTIYERLKTIQCENDIPRVMRGERMIGLVAFQHPEQLFGSDAPNLSPEASLTWRAEDCLFFLQTMSELIEYCTLPYSECRRKAKTLLEDVLDQVKSSAPENGRLDGSAQLLPGAVVFGIEGAAPTIAFRNIALAAIACRRYARAENRLPNALEELVPQYLTAIPGDPFTGDLLRVRISERGITIYSVGRDEDDDGGLNDVNTGDISWLVLKAEEHPTREVTEK